MRIVATGVLLALLAGVSGQTGNKDKTPRRYGVELDTKKYPQNTPKDALGSVLKAISEKQIDYLLAHLADPAFVDQRVSMNMARLGGELSDMQKKALAFDDLVKTTADHFLKDPTKLTELQRFFKDGDWTEEGNDATARLKGLQARMVLMKKVAPDRWVLLDREK